MSAAELRALASEVREADLYNQRFSQAAEIIELIAWAEENRRCPQYEARVTRPPYWSVMYRGDQYHGDTLIGTLRRAREAAR